MTPLPPPAVPHIVVSTHSLPLPHQRKEHTVVRAGWETGTTLTGCSMHVAEEEKEKKGGGAWPECALPSPPSRQWEPRTQPPPRYPMCSAPVID